MLSDFDWEIDIDSLESPLETLAFDSSTSAHLCDQIGWLPPAPQAPHPGVTPSSGPDRVDQADPPGIGDVGKLWRFADHYPGNDASRKLRVRAL